MGQLHVIRTKTLLRHLGRSRGQFTPWLSLAVAHYFRAHVGAWITLPELIDYAYGYRGDGGPGNATRAMRMVIYELRRSGMPIDGRRSRGYRHPSAPVGGEDLIGVAGGDDPSAIEPDHAR